MNVDELPEDVPRKFEHSPENYSKAVLKDRGEAHFGWAVAEQFENLIDGEEFEEMNFNALKRIEKFLREVDEPEMANDIRFFSEEVKRMNPSITEGLGIF